MSIRSWLYSIHNIFPNMKRGWFITRIFSNPDQCSRARLWVALASHGRLCNCSRQSNNWRKQSGLSEPRGARGSRPRFWQIITSISTQGADYAYKITTCPSPRIFRPFYGPALGFDDIRPRRLKCGQAILNFVQKLLLKQEQNKKICWIALKM